MSIPEERYVGDFTSGSGEVRDLKRQLDAHIGKGGNAHAIATPEEAGFMSQSDKQKINSVENGATQNQTDEYLLNLANATGELPIARVDGLQEEIDRISGDSAAQLREDLGNDVEGNLGAHLVAFPAPDGEDWSVADLANPDNGAAMVAYGDGTVSDALDKVDGIEFDRAKYSLVLAKDQFDNAETFDAGHSVVLAYRPNGGTNANKLPGTQDYRYLIGGYDNLIEATTPAEINGRACGHVVTHHSEMKGQSNHTAIVGGSFNIAQDAWYCFLTGTQNEVKKRTSTGYSAYNFLAGTRNSIQGNSSAAMGSNNHILDECVGSFVAGAENEVGYSFSASLGAFNKILGINALAAGRSNQVGPNSFACGFTNNIGTAQFSTVSGAGNTNTADYARTFGRGAVVTAAHDHGDVCAHNVGTERSFTMTLPLRAETGSAAPTTLLRSVVGNPSVVTLLPNAVCQYEIMVTACSTDMLDHAAFKVTGMAIKVGTGGIEHKGVNVTEVFSTDSTNLSVSAGTGSTVNAQFRVDQGASTKDFKWTASIKILVREISV